MFAYHYLIDKPDKYFCTSKKELLNTITISRFALFFFQICCKALLLVGHHNNATAEMACYEQNAFTKKGNKICRCARNLLFEKYWYISVI